MQTELGNYFNNQLKNVWNYSGEYVPQCSTARGQLILDLIFKPEQNQENISPLFNMYTNNNVAITIFLAQLETMIINFLKNYFNVNGKSMFYHDYDKTMIVINN